MGAIKLGRTPNHAPTSNNTLSAPSLKPLQGHQWERRWQNNAAGPGTTTPGHGWGAGAQKRTPRMLHRMPPCWGSLLQPLPHAGGTTRRQIL